MANLANHLINILDSNDNIVASGYTNSNGDLSFSLPEGSYKVSVAAPSGYGFMSATISDANNSNNNVSALPVQGIDVVKGTPANVIVNFIEI